MMSRLASSLLLMALLAATTNAFSPPVHQHASLTQRFSTSQQDYDSTMSHYEQQLAMFSQHNNNNHQQQQQAPPVANVEATLDQSHAEWASLQAATAGAMSASLSSATTVIPGTTFQLEEMEDQDHCGTELTLCADGTVQIHRDQTDGPLFAAAEGVWSLQANNDCLEMILTRHYKAGRQASDVGEFSYPVERFYNGQVTHVGERLAVSGTIHSLEDGLFKNVGYFQMIDSTESEQY